ncbi:class A beta-lactamase, partial [Promicromonospora citrea]|nr:class A beta-lactamase [Promicromonospora citrea]
MTRTTARPHRRAAIALGATLALAAPLAAAGAATA